MAATFPQSTSKPRTEAKASTPMAGVGDHGGIRTAHVAPVLAVYVDGRVHISMAASSLKHRNLDRDPRCVVTTADDVADLVIEGTLERVADDASLHGRVAA